MTEIQYRMVCSILGRTLTPDDLKKMGMSQVDGKFDDDVDYDVCLYLRDMRKQPKGE